MQGQDYAVFTELSPDTKAMTPGFNTRVFTDVDSHQGNSIRCDFKTGAITLAPGSYLRAYDPKATVDPANMRSIPNEDPGVICVGSPCTPNMTPSLFEAYYTTEKEAQIILEHQMGHAPDKIYLRVYVEKSKWHAFARIAVCRICSREARCMKRVAVFGNAGGGKSTLARRLAELTGLPLHVIDMVQFRPDADKVPQKIPHDEYLKLHADLLRRDAWIIDGYGDVPSAWERFAAADTLIHVDLPLATHYWWVTKRLLGGLVASPKGWPDNSPLWSSTMSSYRVLPLCHRQLTPKYRQLVADAAASKRVHHLRSPAQIRSFLDAVRNEHRGGC